MERNTKFVDLHKVASLLRDIQTSGQAELESEIAHEEAVVEDNAFNTAAAKAAVAGHSEFEFNGKKYPVKMSKEEAQKLLDSQVNDEQPVVEEPKEEDEETAEILKKGMEDEMSDEIKDKIKEGDFKSPEGGPLSYKRVGDYTYIVKDENGKEHKAEMGAMGDEQDNYSGDEVEKTMDQEGLAMLIRQAKMGAPVKEAEPMGDVPKFACINIDTGEYGYCHKNELHKYTHYIPADEFTYFDPGSGINYADFDDQMADQEGWKKIPTKQSAGDFKSPEGGPLSYKRVGEYTYIVKDENGKEHKAEAGATDDTQDNYSGDEVEQTMDQKGLEMLIRQAKMGAPVKEAKKELDEEPNEGNEFSGELAKAKKAGKKEFEVDGKKYKVESEEADEEVVAEAPTMDTTQLINLLKNSGISEEQINKKLDEWANTPAGVGEVEPTVHAGDANDDFAQAVNLSLKRYLDAQDMKVNVTESHTKEKLSNAYKDFKAK